MSSRIEYQASDDSDISYDDGGEDGAAYLTSATTWSSTIVAMNFDGAFRSTVASTRGRSVVASGPLRNSETAIIGRALMQALVLRHHGGRYGDGDGEVELFFGQQASFRPTSPDLGRYSVVGDRQAFIVYDHSRYEVVRVPPTVEEWQPASLRRHLEVLRDVPGVRFVVCLFKRRQTPTNDGRPSSNTDPGMDLSCGVPAKARLSRRLGLGGMHNKTPSVDLVALSWTGFAVDNVSVTCHSSAVQSSTARKRSLLRRAADLARHLAVAFKSRVLVAGTFHLSADEASKALTQPSQEKIGNRGDASSVAAEVVTTATKSSSRSRGSVKGYDVTGSSSDKVRSAAANRGVSTSFATRHIDNKTIATITTQRQVLNKSNKTRAIVTLGCDNSFQSRSLGKEPRENTVAAVFGCVSDEPTRDRDRKLPTDRAAVLRQAPRTYCRISTTSPSPCTRGLLELGFHAPVDQHADRLRCYGYRTDTARRRLRSSQLILSFTHPPLKVRHVRPLRCGRLRVDTTGAHHGAMVSNYLDSTRGGGTQRQQRHVDEWSTIGSPWRDPEDYFYWDALSAVVHVDCNGDESFDSSLDEVAEQMAARYKVESHRLSCYY